jgi:hypothetical protein
MNSRSSHAHSKQTNGATRPKSIRILRGDAAQPLWQKLDAFLRTHAYQAYRDSGEAHGKHLDHWTAARARFVSSEVEVRESGVWFHGNCTVANIAADKIQLAIDPSQLVLHIDAAAALESVPQDGGAAVFYWAKWPEPVDPYTAAAYVIEGAVTIEVKKADPAAVDSESAASH